MADDTNTAGREALQTYLKDCDAHAIVPDVGGAWHAAFKAGRASLAASAGSEPMAADGWLHENGLLYRLTDERHPCNRDEINVTMADGSRSIESRSRRALELLDRIRATHPSPPEGSAPASPPMDGEIALIEKAVKRVGITSLLNHGAASCVFTEGCEGVSQEHLLAYTREIALHCAVALGSTPGKMAGWRPIATAPEGQMVVVGWLDPEDHETPERHDFDLLEDGCWQKWHDHAEHVEVIGGHGVSYTPPYTCWLPVPPLPASAKEL